MTKITVNIEANSTEELREALDQLQFGQTVEIHHLAEEPKKEEPSEKPGKEEKKKPAPKPKKEEVSTDLTSETKDSTDKKEVPVDETDPTTSATPNKYPDATKEDVTAAVKKALADKKRNAVRTALERQGVAKVPELDPANYGVFLTDLEVLVGE